MRPYIYGMTGERDKYWAYRQAGTGRAFRIIPSGKTGWAILALTMVLTIVGSWMVAAGLTGLSPRPELAWIGAASMAGGAGLLFYTLKFKTDYTTGLPGSVMLLAKFFHPDALSHGGTVEQVLSEFLSKAGPKNLHKVQAFMAESLANCDSETLQMLWDRADSGLDFEDGTPEFFRQVVAFDPSAQNVRR